MRARPVIGLLLLMTLVLALTSGCAAPAPRASEREYCDMYGLIWRPGLGFCGADGG
jgi:hypothetical protein